MKYFVTDSERTSTNYHEFFKGKWDGVTFWKEDSISLDDNVLYANKGFEEALVTIVTEFDPFGETETSLEQWIQIGKAIPADDRDSLEMFQEADAWLTNVFREYGCFTILGL